MKQIYLFTLILFLGLSSQVNADAVISDLEEAGNIETEPPKKEPRSKSKRPKLTPEEKEKKKAEKKKRQEKMQGCLLLTQSHYKANESAIKSYFDSHPAI